MRKRLLTIWLATLLFGIIFIFWHNEWVYSLPTPVPDDYKEVPKGAAIAAAQRIEHNPAHPLFLHFFNPDCPCSRFNIAYFKTLVKKYGAGTDFVIVPVSKKTLTAKDIENKFGISVPVLFDTTLAAVCGVYSTPQAVIIDTEQHLYYRGNYNRSRYCTEAKSNYAEIALQALLGHQPDITFDKYALQAYGCQLPNCTR